MAIMFTISVNAYSASQEVFLVKPSLVEINEPIFVTGNVLAYKMTNVTPMISGLIEAIHVRVGDRVLKGAPLLTIRQKDIKLQVTKLEHSLTLAQAELQNVKKDLRTNIDLFARKAVSEEVLDNIKTKKLVAEAQLGIANANLMEARQRLEDTVSYAPYNGVITERNADEGSYFQAMSASSRPVLQIQQIDIVVAAVLVPERHLRKIALGTKASIYIDSLDKKFDSEIHLINDRIDLATRGIDVRMGIPNPDYEIKTGLFCRVELTPPPRKVLTVDSESFIRGEDSFVFVVQNGLAEKRAVRLKNLAGGKYEVLTGLDQNSWILAGPDLYLITPGTKVDDNIRRKTVQR
tara:strand:- start:7315 stop:8361 length:1047 start_codon:yes stop_codon:yes gene_type:complete